VPNWVQTSVAGQRLATQLQAVMKVPALTAPLTASCLVVSQDGRVLFDDDGARPVVPASNMKILTAAAALDKLGPNFRYTTAVDAAPAPARGVLNGNLYLVGGGDPLLRTAPYIPMLNPPQPLYTSLAQLAVQVKAAGITKITGSVIGDESRYDTQRAVPTWSPVYVSEGDSGPLSALDVDDGFLVPGLPPVPGATPPIEAAAAFAQLLKSEGVQVAGPPAAGGLPAGAVGVTSIKSAPLSQVLDAILTVSDDTGAELVTKELGRDFGGAGTTAAGTAVIRADLAGRGFDVSQLVNPDGSGLDRLDRVTCGLIASVLQVEGPAGPLGQGLPVAGKTGTLADRMQRTPAAGRLRAKTGTLDKVSALSGFVTAAPGQAGTLAEPLVFSLIMNGVTVTDGVAIGNLLGEVLAAYPSVPPATAVAPLPLGTGW
jgi:D-alanyl-D-alanine carboxypeptidase/D-alanyl-D-alanine-endopeptidase (penicillin-binding protein 4)